MFQKAADVLSELGEMSVEIKEESGQVRLMKQEIQQLGLSCNSTMPLEDATEAQKKVHFVISLFFTFSALFIYAFQASEDATDSAKRSSGAAKLASESGKSLDLLRSLLEAVDLLTDSERRQLELASGSVAEMGASFDMDQMRTTTDHIEEEVSRIDTLLQLYEVSSSSNCNCSPAHLFFSCLIRQSSDPSKLMGGFFCAFDGVFTGYVL